MAVRSRPRRRIHGRLTVRRVVRTVRLSALTVALTVLLALINPVPAAAHVVGTGGSPTNYRTTVTAIRPALPAVAATVGLGGQWVRITNHGAAPIVILISTHAEADFADVIAASPAAGFLHKADLSANAVRRLAVAT